MRLALLTLPTYDNDRIALLAEHKTMLAELTAKFGGATAIEAAGFWTDQATMKHYTDDNVQYQIAMEDTQENVQALWDIAERAGMAMRQKAVMLVLPNGEVVFIDTSMAEAAE